MSFPISSVFQGLKGLVHVTVTADANGAPELIHFVDEAGAACAHFAIHEWDLLGEHISSMLHAELAAPATVDETKHEIFGGTLTDPPAAVTPTQPFQAPELPEGATEQAASAPEDAATSPADEDHQA